MRKRVNVQYATTDHTEAERAFRCPRWLDEHGRKAWQRLLPEVKATCPDLCAADAPALALLASALGQYHQCRELVQEDGLTIPYMPDGGAEVRLPHPLIAAGRDALETAVRAMREFRLTPEARQRAVGSDVHDL